MKLSIHYNTATAQNHVIIQTDDHRLFASEMKDRRNKSTGKALQQIEYIGQHGDPLTTPPDAMRDHRFIIIDKPTGVPLSVHQTLETVAEFLPGHQARGKTPTIVWFDEVSQIELGELDLDITHGFNQVVVFNPFTMTGQWALEDNANGEITFIEPKDKRTKSDSTTCRTTSGQFLHIIESTKCGSIYRFAVLNAANRQPLSLHTTIPNVIPFLAQHRIDGYAVQLINAKGQAINA